MTLRPRLLALFVFIFGFAAYTFAGTIVFPPPGTNCFSSIASNNGSCGGADVHLSGGGFVSGESGTTWVGGLAWPSCQAPEFGILYRFSPAVSFNITVRNTSGQDGQSLRLQVQDGFHSDGTPNVWESTTGFPQGGTATVSGSGTMILSSAVTVMNSNGAEDWNFASWEVLSIDAVQPVNPTVTVGVSRAADGTYSANVGYTMPANSGANGTVTLQLLPSGEEPGQTYFTQTGLSGSGSIVQPLGAISTDRMLMATAYACDGSDEQEVSVSGCSKCNPPTSVGPPVRLFDGAMTYTEKEPLPSTLGTEFRREYSTTRLVDSPFGRGWSSVFDARTLMLTQDNQRIAVILEDGQRVAFRQQNGAWTQSWPEGGSGATLTGSEATGYVFLDGSASLERTFGANHHLTRLRDVRSGRAVSITYDATGHPLTIADEGGQWSCTVTNSGDHVTNIAVDGRPDISWTYGYTGSLLTSVTLASAPAAWRTYEYSNNLMTAARDATGTLIESHTYDANGRANSWSDSSGDVTNIQYPASANGISTTTLTRADNSQATYEQAFAGGSVVTRHADAGCSACGANDSTAAFDDHGNVIRLQNGRGYITESVYDSAGRNVTTERTALAPSGCDPETDPAHCRLSSDALKAASLVTTPVSRTTTYTYGDSHWPSRPTRISRDSVVFNASSSVEQFTFDATSGQVLVHSITGTLDSSQTQETRTTTTTLYVSGEAAAFAPGGAFQSAWLTLPQPAGLRKAVDGPRSDVSDVMTFVYYPNDSSVPGPWRGQLAAVRNSLGQISRLEDYDVFGHPGTNVDPNGVVKRQAYDALGRVLTSTVAAVPGCDTAADPLCATDLTATQTYQSLTGPLLTTQRPAGDLATYAYDARGRVLTYSRGTATTPLEKMDFTYDQTTGKKATETISSFSGGSWVVTKSESYAYTSDGSLLTVTHADSTAVHYDYFPDGSLKSLQDENHSTPNTTYTYDAAGHLATVAQTLAGAPGGKITTSYGYDSAGNLTSVTDPNQNTTTYAYDDFGQMRRQTSPISGTTTTTYDAAGNALTVTDANGAVTTRTYDALNRPTSSASTGNDPTESITSTYDNTTPGNFGIGKPATTTEPTGSDALRYDRRGNLRVETKTIAGAAYTTSFGYDANGNRNLIVYPSGLTAQTTYDFADRPYSLTAGTTTIVSSAAYLPFGPATSIAFGNGTTRTAQYDARYRPLENRFNGPGGTLADYTYAEDNAGNITQIHDAMDARYNRDFGYDDINRLTTANSGSLLWGAGSYSYDSLGDVITSSLGSWKSITASLNGTGKLTSMLDTGVTRAVTYDAAGNETAVGTSTFTYSPRNRLAAANALTFAYDARGLLTVATTPSIVLTVPSTINGGNSGSGSVTIGSPTPADLTISLSSDNAAATVPASVVIPAGSAAATFTIGTTPVTANATATITATLNGTSQSATVTVLAPRVIAISVNPTTAYAGDSVTATVTLADPATSPTAVLVKGPLVGSPVSGTVPTGSTTASVSIVPERLFTDAPRTFAIFGTIDNVTQVYTSLTVKPPDITALSVTPATVTGGASTTAQATVSGTVDFMPFIDGVYIPITSSNPALAGDPSISILVPNTGTSGTGRIITAPVASTTSVVLTGTTNTTVTRSSSLTLQAVPVTISSFTVSPASILGSGSVTGTITLTAAAPTGGLDIEIASNNAAAIPVPPFVHINAGVTSAPFTINTTVVNASTAVTLSATHSVTTKTAALTVTAPSGNHLGSLYAQNGAPTANGVATHGGTPVTLTVVLQTLASSNTRVNLSSSNTAVASVPSSVTVAKNTQNTDFTVSTFSVANPATATITATLNSVVLRIVVTVLPANAVTVAGVSVVTPLPGGSGRTGTVSLTGPAPAGGAVVTLGGARTDILTLPASVTVAASANSASFTYTGEQFLGNVHTADVTATYMGMTQSARIAVQPVVLQAGAERREPVQCASLSLGPCLTAAVLRAVPMAAGDPSRYYFYTPELRLLAESELSTSSSKAIAWSYLWFGGMPVAQIESGTNTTRFYATDHLDTPLMMTDATGSVVWRIEQAPYGTTFALRAGATLRQPLRFPGQLAIDGNETVYNVHRWYRSDWGRYTQVDPLAVGGLGIFVRGQLTRYTVPNVRKLEAHDDAVKEWGVGPFSYAADDPLVVIDRVGLKALRCKVFSLISSPNNKLRGKCVMLGECVSIFDPWDIEVTFGTIYIPSCFKCPRKCTFEAQGNAPIWYDPATSGWDCTPWTPIYRSKEGPLDGAL
jgi:RHS repeat-associated protein